MQYEDKVSLSKLRLETSKECLKDSLVLIDSESYKASATVRIMRFFTQREPCWYLTNLTARNIRELFLNLEKDILKQIFSMSRFLK